MALVQWCNDLIFFSFHAANETENEEVDVSCFGREIRQVWNVNREGSSDFDCVYLIYRFWRYQYVKTGLFDTRIEKWSNGGFRNEGGQGVGTGA